MMGLCVTPKAQAPKEEPGTVGFNVKSFHEISTCLSALPALRKLGLQDHGFEVSFNHMARQCLKINKQGL